MTALAFGGPEIAAAALLLAAPVAGAAIRRYVLALPEDGPGAGPLLRRPVTEAAAFAVALPAALAAPGWLAPVSALLGLALLALALADLRAMLLPDALTLPLLAAGLAVAAVEGALAERAIGAAAAGGLGAAVALLYARLRGREGLGWGDVKLLAAAGAWLGWRALPDYLLLAAGAGILAALALRASGRAGALRAESELPFGLFLAAALQILWLHGRAF